MKLSQRIHKILVGEIEGNKSNLYNILFSLQQRWRKKGKLQSVLFFFCANLCFQPSCVGVMIQFDEYFVLVWNGNKHTRTTCNRVIPPIPVTVELEGR